MALTEPAAEATSRAVTTFPMAILSKSQRDLQRVVPQAYYRHVVLDGQDSLGLLLHRVGGGT